MMKYSAVDFGLLVENLTDGIVVMDMSRLIIEYINPAVKSLLAITSNDTHAPILPSMIFKNSVFKKLYDIYQDQSLPSSFYQNHPTIIGNVLNLSLMRLVDNRCAVIIKDYTHMQQLEQMRTDFVGNVSHELRTPLTVILGYLENFTLTDDIKPAWMRGLKLMHEQAIRMNDLINDLLMLSRLESDETKPMAEVNMPRLLMQVFDQASASNQAGHLIDIHLDTDKNILGIEAYLYSAIINLVLNAIKYTPSGGMIDIIYEEDDGDVHLSVTDNGIGIGGEHLGRLTERFYRVDSGRSRATGGTGLGLAIVKHVLNKHNARLEISSEEGVGSMFRIIFPKIQTISTQTLST